MQHHHIYAKCRGKKRSAILNAVRRRWTFYERRSSLYSWKNSSARCVGSSHIASGTPCQDSVFTQFDGDIAVAVLADGAGSAKYSHYGSEYVVRRAAELLVKHLDEALSPLSKRNVFKHKLIWQLQRELQQMASEGIVLDFNDIRVEDVDAGTDADGAGDAVAEDVDAEADGANNADDIVVEDVDAETKAGVDGVGDVDNAVVEDVDVDFDDAVFEDADADVDDIVAEDADADAICMAAADDDAVAENADATDTDNDNTDDVRGAASNAAGIAVSSAVGRISCRVRDLASTLLVVAVRGNRYLALHVGDGVICAEVIRNGEPSLEIISTPKNGEFANETVFVTSNQAIGEANVRRGFLETSTSLITGFVLMSDGPEAALYHKSSKMPAPACKKLLDACRSLDSSEMDIQLATTLENVIAKKTSDDCSIALLARVEKSIS